MMIATFFSLFLVNSAWSGNGNVVGNGGNLVRCSSVTNLTSDLFFANQTLLDLFEGQVEQNLSFKNLIQLRSLNLEDAIEKSAKMFFKNDPEMQFHFRSFWLNFKNQTQFVETMPQLPSSLSLVANHFHCKVFQAATQLTASYPNAGQSPQIKLVSSIWLGKPNQPGLPTDQKVALVIHEFLLNHFLIYQGPNCTHRIIRQKTARFLSDEALSLKSEDWSQQIFANLCGEN